MERREREGHGRLLLVNEERERESGRIESGVGSGDASSSE